MQWQNAGGSALIGVANTADSLQTTGGNPYSSFIVNTNNGYLISMAGGSETDLFSITSGAGLQEGAWLFFEVDTGNGDGSSGTAQIWVSILNGDTLYPWNNSETADPDNNVGGIAIPQITSFTPISQVYSDGTATTTINTGQTAYARTMGTTFADLPATIAFSVAPPGIGSPVHLDWTDGSDVTGLNYQVDGGEWTACTGQTTGVSGVALGPAFTQAGMHTIALQSESVPIDASQTQYFFVAPAGADPTPVASASGSYQGSSTAFTYALAGGPYEKVFVELSYAYVGGVTGPGLLQAYDATGQESSAFTFSSNSGSVTMGGGGPAGGEPPASGPTQVTLQGNQIIGGGTLDASIAYGTSAQGTATISIGGTVTQYGELDDLVVWPGSQQAPFDSVVWTPGSLFGGVVAGFAIYVPQPPESLTITSASYGDNTLTITGGYSNATLTEVAVSTDDGDDFADGSSLGTTSNTYTVSLIGALAPGTYELQTKDASSGVLSNIYPLTVNGPGAFPVMVLAFA